MEVEGCGFTNKEDIEELYNNRLIKLQSEIKRLMRETQEVEKNKTEALEIMEIYMA